MPKSQYVYHGLTLAVEDSKFETKTKDQNYPESRSTIYKNLCTKKINKINNGWDVGEGKITRA